MVCEQRIDARPFLGAMKEKTNIVHSDGNLTKICNLHAEANVLRSATVWDCMRWNDLKLHAILVDGRQVLMMPSTAPIAAMARVAAWNSVMLAMSTNA